MATMYLGSSMLLILLKMLMQVAIIVFGFWPGKDEINLPMKKGGRIHNQILISLCYSCTKLIASRQGVDGCSDIHITWNMEMTGLISLPVGLAVPNKYSM
jgi:hypothetical protein